MHTVRSSQNCVITQVSWLPDVSQWTNVWHSALDSIPHQPQESLLNDCGLEGHLQIPCLVGTERGVLVELLDQVGDECLHLWCGSLIDHPARLRYCRFLEDTLYCYREQLLLDGLPLHVANDVEVFAQVTPPKYMTSNSLSSNLSVP